MQSPSHSKEQRSASRGLLPFHRMVVASRSIGVPFADTKKAARVCLSHLVAAAFPSSAGGEYDLVADVSMRRWSRWVQVPVDVEVLSASGSRPGVIAHLHWQARRHRKLFPVMEGDLVARPTSGASTELILEGTYHPPFGILGFVGDLLLGRLVARSTAEAFVEDLGRSLEATVREGRCAVRRPLDRVGEVA